MAHRAGSVERRRTENAALRSQRGCRGAWRAHQRRRLSCCASAWRNEGNGARNISRGAAPLRNKHYPAAASINLRSAPSPRIALRGIFAHCMPPLAAASKHNIAANERCAIRKRGAAPLVAGGVRGGCGAWRSRSENLFLRMLLRTIGTMATASRLLKRCLQTFIWVAG